LAHQWHYQAAVDILATLGWNGGRGRVTKSAGEAVWWYGQQGHTLQDSADAVSEPSGQSHNQPISLEGPDVQIGIILAHFINKFKGQSGTRSFSNF
jgi:hypothetical protein